MAWLPDGVPATEFSDAFVAGMANRMATSYCKYGAVADAYPRKVDAIASLELRLAKYRETGNTEYLMDVANFAMIEFMHPRHAAAHFKAEDSAASPGRVWSHGTTTQESNDRREMRRFYQRDGD